MPPAQDDDSIVRVFISYRRRDSETFALALHGAIKELDPDAFLDVRVVQPGEQFEDVIAKKVDRATVVVAVIGRSWLVTGDAESVPGVDTRPSKWVERELVRAHGRGTSILPVLVDGAEPLTDRSLPRPLGFLRRLHAHVLRNGSLAPDIKAFIDGFAAAHAHTLRERRRVRPPSQVDMLLDRTTVWTEITRQVAQGNQRGARRQAFVVHGSADADLRYLAERIRMYAGDLGSHAVVLDRQYDGCEASSRAEWAAYARAQLAKAADSPTGYSLQQSLDRFQRGRPVLVLAVSRGGPLPLSALDDQFREFIRTDLGPAIGARGSPTHLVLPVEAENPRSAETWVGELRAVLGTMDVHEGTVEHPAEGDVRRYLEDCCSRLDGASIERVVQAYTAKARALHRLRFGELSRALDELIEVEYNALIGPHSRDP